MVDLAKIRKKVKDKKAADAAESGSPSSNAVSSLAQSSAASATVEDQPDLKRKVPAEPVEIESGRSKLDRYKATAGQVHRFVNQVSRDIAADDGGVLELLTFVIASERYALEIEKIVEIIPPRTATRVPNTDRAILGIISLRGTIVTLLDVRKGLGHPPGVVDPNHSRIIVIERSGEIAGFLVDRVTRVIKLPKAEVETQPVVHPLEQNESIRGVFQQEGQLTILLDLEALIR